VVPANSVRLRTPELMHASFKRSSFDGGGGSGHPLHLSVFSTQRNQEACCQKHPALIDHLRLLITIVLAFNRLRHVTPPPLPPFSGASVARPRARMTWCEGADISPIQSDLRGDDRSFYPGKSTLTFPSILQHCTLAISWEAAKHSTSTLDAVLPDGRRIRDWVIVDAPNP
jgi:hypothetical protein